MNGIILHYGWNYPSLSYPILYCTILKTIKYIQYKCLYTQDYSIDVISKTEEDIWNWGKEKENQVWDVNRQAKVYFLNLIIGQTKCAVLNVQNHLVSRHISDNKNVWISNSLEKVKCKKTT